jgi:hypothetical protein
MNFIASFRQNIQQNYNWLTQISAEKAAFKPAPNKWSPKEIIGHLIDSANNNHRRFTKAQWQEDLIFKGYEQENWVKVQHYQAADWQLLLHLWKYYNLHICHLMENTPTDLLNKPTKEHNFHQIAMRTIPKESVTTLAYFMEDYIYHIDHHLQQIKDMFKK